MLIDIKDVMHDKSGTGNDRVFEVHPDIDTYEFMGESYPVVGKESFELSVSSPDRNKVCFAGKSSIVLKIPCARCLEAVQEEIVFEVDKEINLEDEADSDLHDGFSVDVDKLLYSEIFMSMPTKVLCSEECKGLCPVCGKNLNSGNCDCDRFVPDPRMAAISDVFQQFIKS